jgi:tRNA(fMet)-specific endonuclease VapC
VILLDTDHLTVLKYTDNERFARLHGRLLAAAPELIGTTIVNVEEQMRGWLAAIAKERTLLRQITTWEDKVGSFHELSCKDGVELCLGPALVC